MGPSTAPWTAPDASTTRSIKYQATVVEEGKPDQFYVGVTEPPWKKRYGGHKSNMRHSQRICSSLAGYVWKLKDEGREFDVNPQPHQQLLSNLLVR